MKLVHPSNSNATVQVMTKTPEAGKVKTRLAKSWGNEAALDAYLMLVKKTILAVEESGLPRQLHIAGPMQHPLWQQALERGWVLKPQNGNSLGEKMQAASEHQRSILVGCDFPGLSAKLLQDVNSKLRCYDVVAIPATDGGYVLLATNQTHAPLFHGHHWGSDTVWETTLTAIQNLNLSHYTYPAENDLDTAEDWQLAVEAGLLPAKQRSSKAN